MKTYTVEKLARLDAETKTITQSIRYWRLQARGILMRFPLAEVVIADSRTEAIINGYLRRGNNRPCDPMVYLIIASTGGKWGRSREDLLGEGLLERAVDAR